MTTNTDLPEWRPHSSHWGAFGARLKGDCVEVVPHKGDPDPSPLLQNVTTALRHPARITRPMVRRDWVRNGPGPQSRRIGDDFVELPWDEALDMLARELGRVKDTFGAGAIYGGSYGWASAGRFHHAQSQIHRFLNVALGGYVRSVNSYSAGASAVILPHVICSLDVMSRRNITWDQIATHTDTVLAFGGMSFKNMMVAPGGVSRHIERSEMRRAVVRGTSFQLVSPLRDDLPTEAEGTWHPIRPGSDVALMLGLAHVLVSEGRHDRPFLDRYCSGYDLFEAYLLGRSDQSPKTAAWAASICGLPEADIVALARKLAQGRSLITVSHSLQRAEFGEQPVWMALVLAAMLGQIGLPGGGYHYGLGAIGQGGRADVAVQAPSLPQGRNAVRDFIPVARISDMLLNPGAAYDYNGQRMTYPDIRLVYWAGGNPFHHHQDLDRLTEAFARPDTIVVHESAWTATARMADIVLPTTLSLERDDIGASSADPLMVAMRGVAPPIGEARDDYTILSALAARLGAEAAFTEGRDTMAWLRWLYDKARGDAAASGVTLCDFDTFWEKGEVVLPSQPDDGGPIRAFRLDPEAAPLQTPSGRIEIHSGTIAGFGYADCPGHPTWLASTEPPSTAFPLVLVANQPATRLHSQLDFGALSQAQKVHGREVMRINPVDAAARGIRDDDIVRIFNHRGACLAAARLSEDVAKGVLQLPTGAWYDPLRPVDDRPLCVHGNPNVLTRDLGTSRLAQGCIGQTTVVQCEKYVGPVPPIRAFLPPETK